MPVKTPVTPPVHTDSDFPTSYQAPAKDVELPVAGADELDHEIAELRIGQEMTEDKPLQ